MKYHEPRFITLVNASIVTGVYFILYVLAATFVFHYPFNHFSAFLYLILTCAGLFLLCYFIFSYSLERFIYSKIRLVYKSIHSVKTGKGGAVQPAPGSRMLDTVSRDVETWKEEKSREIEQLKHLETYRREFIGNVAHELKTPLFNIQGYILTLLDGGLEDPAINREYLKRTEKSVDRLIRIVEDLDEIAQLESGELQLRITRFDIVAIAHEVVEHLELKAAKAGITITVMRHEKPVWVEGDREKIRQVLVNIVDNSIRYGRPEKGKTKISFFDMGDNILTEVTDNGIGIEEEDLPRVFERFYRTKKGRDTTRKGKGLGLAIVKHIIEAHNQTVNVRSAPGVGTTFGFTLKKP